MIEYLLSLQWAYELNTWIQLVMIGCGSLGSWLMAKKNVWSPLFHAAAMTCALTLHIRTGLYIISVMNFIWVVMDMRAYFHWRRDPVSPLPVLQTH